MREVLHRIVQRLGKGLDEGAAARRAGFVEQYVVNGLVLDLDALHVLAADVQDTVHIRLKIGCGIIVGDRLYFALIQKKGGLNERLSVTGRAGVDDLYAFWQPAVDILDRHDGGSKGISVIIVVEGIKKRSVFVHQSGFCSGGAGVDPEKCLALAARKIPDRNLVSGVALLECVEVGLAGE
ncbi:hypothetical protein IMSAGC020_02211 [Lachnospiraceae bacterium]|nr:hypothetical protein IMSAGC020_02211 [Lachnospiraceae bacterium]